MRADQKGKYRLGPIGIILRGSAFIFRKYDVKSPRGTAGAQGPGSTEPALSAVEWAASLSHSAGTEHRPPGLCAQRSCTPLPCERKADRMSAWRTGRRHVLPRRNGSRTI